MSFALLIRRTAIAAVALSLTAFGMATMPAAAKPQIVPMKPQLPQFPPKPIFNPNPPKQPGPVAMPVKPIDICVIMPSKCAKPVVNLPPPVIVAPPPVVVEAPPHIVTQPVYVPRPVAVQAPAASESCNCLTKQYQDDGSVLFRDVCTHEAAVATKEDLQAQAQAAAQNQTQPAPAK